MIDLTHEKFWLVWSPAGNTPPTVRHASERSAVQEAERLARIHKGREVIVLVSVSRSCVEEPKITHSFHDSDVPF